VSLLVLVVLPLLLFGCGGRNVQLADQWLPVRLSSRVKLAGEPALNRTTGAPMRLSIVGIAADVRRGSRSPKPFRLVVKAADGTHHIFFAALSEDLEFPVAQGEKVAIDYVARWDTKAGLSRRAMVIRDGEGEIVLLFQDHNVLDASAVPAGLAVEPLKDVVYTEAGRLARLCLTVVEHRRLELTAGDEKLALTPGERKVVTIKGTTYTVAAVDNARTTTWDCADYRPDRLAWFAIRMPPQPATEVPAD